MEKYCVSCWSTIIKPNFLYCYNCNSKKSTLDTCNAIKKDGTNCTLKCMMDRCLNHKKQSRRFLDHL